MTRSVRRIATHSFSLMEGSREKNKRVFYRACTCSFGVGESNERARKRENENNGERRKKYWTRI